MLDIKFIREHTEEVRQNLKNRHAINRALVGGGRSPS